MARKTSQRHLSKAVVLHRGDCLIILPTLPENSVDACLVDPPYHLESIVKRFGKTGETDKVRTTSGPHQRTARNFIDQNWDSDIAFRPETWKHVFRVLKPGAWIASFAGTRTYHRIACAIEGAGFVIYDMIGWTYGTGFPKRRELLKPALEPICLARKPLSERTVEANIQRWGTGRLNIDACRFGKWPANIITDGSDEVSNVFPNGSAARFFYQVKADGNDRLVSNHPSVKPINLLQYLARLITPKGGVILDPFAGSGTTAEAAYREQMKAILIENDPQYQKDICQRICIMQEGGYARDIARMSRRKPTASIGLFGEPDNANQTRRASAKAGNGRTRSQRS